MLRVQEENRSTFYMIPELCISLSSPIEGVHEGCTAMTAAACYDRPISQVRRSHVPSLASSFQTLGFRQLIWPRWLRQCRANLNCCVCCITRKRVDTGSASAKTSIGTESNCLISFPGAVEPKLLAQNASDAQTLRGVAEFGSLRRHLLSCPVPRFSDWTLPVMEVKEEDALRCQNQPKTC